MRALIFLATAALIVGVCVIGLAHGLINAPVYDLYAGAKYKSIKDLKGTTIGVTGLIT